MPLYDWKELNSGKEVTIVRHFSEYESIPTREEAAELTDEEYTNAKWERIIGGNIHVQRGLGWGGKGSW